MAVNLSKGQKISLNKEAGSELQTVFMGLGWDVAKSGGFLGFGGSSDVDLDASCFVFDQNNQLIDVVYFGKLTSNDGAIQHSGDNLTGAGDGDDEMIKVTLNRLNPQVKALVFTVSSYRGQTFDKVNNAFCRLVNHANGQEVARYNLSATGNHTAQIMAKLYLHNGEWKMHAIGESASASTPDKLLPYLVNHL